MPIFKVGEAVMAKMALSHKWSAACPAKIEEVHWDEENLQGYKVFFFGYSTSSLLKPLNVRQYKGCPIKRTFLSLSINSNKPYLNLTAYIAQSHIFAQDAFQFFYWINRQLRKQRRSRARFTRLLSKKLRPTSNKPGRGMLNQPKMSSRRRKRRPSKNLG